jgi:hypothetical protein
MAISGSLPYATISKVKLPPLKCFIHLKVDPALYKIVVIRMRLCLHTQHLWQSCPTPDSKVLKGFRINDASFYPGKAQGCGLCHFFFLINDKIWRKSKTFTRARAKTPRALKSLSWSRMLSAGTKTVACKKAVCCPGSRNACGRECWRRGCD